MSVTGKLDPESWDQGHGFKGRYRTKDFTLGCYLRGFLPLIASRIGIVYYLQTLRTHSRAF